MIKNNKEKIKLGQFFTIKDDWLTNPIKNFILLSKCSIAYDPFAGNGNLLKCCKEKLNLDIKGLDIDPKLNWEINDSLNNIPKIENSIIITNPPYVCKKKNTTEKLLLDDYFSNSKYDNIYYIALDRILESCDYCVVIVPESIIFSNYEKRNRLTSITLLDKNIFNDTTCPICIVCFDNKIKKFNEIKIYNNSSYITTYQNILDWILEPKNNIKIEFNSKKGWLGLVGGDSKSGKEKIRFDFKENIKYDWNKISKRNSRYYSLIDINIPLNRRQEFIDKCNNMLNSYRKETLDLGLPTFKGYTTSGLKRKILRFKNARALMERVYEEMFINYLLD